MSREQGRRYITNIVRKIHDAVKAEKPWGIFCTFTLIPLLKYVTIVLSADDNGEGAYKSVS